MGERIVVRVVVVSKRDALWSGRCTWCGTDSEAAGADLSLRRWNTHTAQQTTQDNYQTNACFGDSNVTQQEQRKTDNKDSSPWFTAPDASEDTHVFGKQGLDNIEKNRLLDKNRAHVYLRRWLQGRTEKDFPALAEPPQKGSASNPAPLTRLLEPHLP